MCAMAYQTRNTGDGHNLDRPTKPVGGVQPAQDLEGKALVNINTGEKLGSIADLLFDPQSLRIAAVLVAAGGGSLSSLFTGGATTAIPASAVRVWGKDAVLVEAPNTIPVEKIDGYNNLVKLSDQIRDRYVVSTDGRRVGQVEDVLVDNQGRLAGYSLSQVFIEGPLADSRQIPVEATSALGQDVLLVDMNRI